MWLRPRRGAFVAVLALLTSGLTTAALAPMGIASAAAAPASPVSVVPGARDGRRLYPTVGGADAQPSAQLATVAESRVTYGGGVHGIGVTTGPPQVYVVFWGSQWGTATPVGSANFANDTAGVAPRVLAMLAGLGTNNELWSGVATQYCEGVPVGTTVCPASVGYPAGGALAGTWNDTGSAVPANATGHQIGVEAVAAATHFGNTTPASNRNAQYVIVSPTGTHPDGFNANGGFCAWHDWNGDGYVGAPSSVGDIAFTNLPYLPDTGGSCGANFVNAGHAGALDGVTIVAGHEYTETITDQNPSGGWTDADGEEISDKCAWISSGPGAAQNVAFATGVFAMQSNWSNDGATCAISHPIWGTPDGPDDYVLAVAPATAFVSQGDATTTQVSALTVTGTPESLTLAASDLPPDTTASFAPSTMSSDGASTLTVSTAPTTPFGVYNVTVAASGSVSHTATFSIQVGGPPGVLLNGVPLLAVSGLADSEQYWRFDVPAQGGRVSFSTAGGSGDVDLFVRKGAPPTETAYDCRPGLAGNRESCDVEAAQGTWYVMLRGFTDFDNVTVSATSANPVAIVNRHSQKLITGATTSKQYWSFDVPAGRRQVKFTISGFTGDADLYVKYGALPSTADFGCRPAKIGKKPETCTIKFPSAGRYYVMITAPVAFTRLTLKGVY